MTQFFPALTRQGITFPLWTRPFPLFPLYCLSAIQRLPRERSDGTTLTPTRALMGTKRVGPGDDDPQGARSRSQGALFLTQEAPGLSYGAPAFLEWASALSKGGRRCAVWPNERH